jgi:hypothetical protein
MHFAEDQTIIVEIDGVSIGQVHVDKGDQMGAWHGWDENTKPTDKIRTKTPRQPGIWFLECHQHKSDGGVWGIRGAFRRGEWANVDGQVVYRVWERIA